VRPRYDKHVLYLDEYVNSQPELYEGETDLVEQYSDATLLSLLGLILIGGLLITASSTVREKVHILDFFQNAHNYGVN
jgi:hypothetical protein